MQKKSVLLITCTVGYGHQAAAMNVEEFLRQEDPELNILHLDTRQYFPPGVGKISDQWDRLMRKGHFSVSKVVNFQGAYEAFYERFLDFHLSNDLAALFNTHEISAVYDVQPMFTPIFHQAFTQAALHGPIPYHKILTDLPTPRNSSFFTGIKRATKNDRVLLKVHAPAPLLAPGETAESFWQTHCGISAKQVDSLFAFPVHPHYLNPPTNLHSLKINRDSDEPERLELPENAFVTTLMLGSQGVNAIYDYALTYLEQINIAKPQQPHYFFIACSKNQALYENLQKLLADHPLHRETPHRVIPLTMQTMDSIASLMWRSNQMIIRSGGISSIEQLALARVRQDARILWIHSAHKGNDPEECLNHTYSWERGNAEYLMEHLGARMTAPQLIGFFGVG